MDKLLETVCVLFADECLFEIERRHERRHERGHERRHEDDHAESQKNPIEFQISDEGHLPSSYVLEGLKLLIMWWITR